MGSRPVEQCYDAMIGFRELSIHVSNASSFSTLWLLSPSRPEKSLERFMSRPFHARQGLKGNIFLGHNQGDSMHCLVKEDNNTHPKKSSKLSNQNLISATLRETRLLGTVNMALILSTAVELDADRIAATHMAAFGPVRDGLRTSIARRA